MVDNLIFTLAFKGKQSIKDIYDLKYSRAKKYQDQIMEYYKELNNEMEKSLNKNKIRR